MLVDKWKQGQIVHRVGRDNPHVNTLSCQPPIEKNSSESEAKVCAIVGGREETIESLLQRTS